MYNVCNVELQVFDNINGVVVSGGADSALLLYFLLKFSTRKLHIFTLSSLHKVITNTKNSIDVVSKCAELTNNYNFEHHIKYIPENQENESLFYLPKKLITQGYIYSGITADPPKEITDTFIFPSTETHVRDPNKLRPTVAGNICRPWTNIDKKKIAEIYKEYDLIDSLFPLTRSCEWTVNMIDEIPDPGSKHCGQCWWCQERKWGFGTL